MFDRDKRLFPSVVRAPRTDPIYNCHGYLTKIPVEAIIPFIEHYSEPGNIVADVFAGSGMTGIAASISGRDALLSDISVLGKHIADGYLSKVSSEKFLKQANDIISSARFHMGELYQTIRFEDNQQVEMIRTIWSFVYRCPSCSFELIFYEPLINSPNSTVELCPECGSQFSKKTWKSIKDIPVGVVVNGLNGKQIEQVVQKVDILNIEKALNDKRLKSVPTLSISSDREMYSRSGLSNKGISETKQFFSARNALILSKIWNEILTVSDKKLKKKLQFAFTAILPRASRRYQWSSKRPLNAQNQTYYISPVYYEWNVFDLFLRKVKSVIRSDKAIFGSKDELFRKNLGNVDYTLSSADSLNHIKSDSVDYIFTDPPFGSNIFYSDMSLFHEAWLGDVTINDKEAVIHTCGKNRHNAEERYEELLRGAFRESYRILKPGRYMSVVFGNSKGSVWSLVLRALREAGFDSVPVDVSILDKGQRSVKGLSSGSESVVTVDLILTIHKSSGNLLNKPKSTWRQANPEKLLKAAVEEASNGDSKNPSYLYANILRKAINQHLLVDNLHLSDVLIALRKAGYSIDSKTGLLKYAK